MISTLLSNIPAAVKTRNSRLLAASVPPRPPRPAFCRLCTILLSRSFILEGGGGFVFFRAKMPLKDPTAADAPYSAQFFYFLCVLFVHAMNSSRAESVSGGRRRRKATPTPDWTAPPPHPPSPALLLQVAKQYFAKTLQGSGESGFFVLFCSFFVVKATTISVLYYPTTRRSKGGVQGRLQRLMGDGVLLCLFVCLFYLFRGLFGGRSRAGCNVSVYLLVSIAVFHNFTSPPSPPAFCISNLLLMYTYREDDDDVLRI